MLCVGCETIRDIDHRARAMTGQPAAGLDAWLGTGVSVAQGGRHRLARAKLRERQRGTSQIPGDPESVTFARTGAAHRPLDLADDAHIDDVSLRARQIPAQHPRFEIVRHGGDARHDVGGGIGPVLTVWRDAQRHEHTQRRCALSRKIRHGGAGSAKTDLFEVEPIGPEMHVLEGIVDADRQRRRPQRNQGAVVAEIRDLARDLGDPRQDAADAIELFAGAEIHRDALYYNTSGASSSASTGGRAGFTSFHALHTSGSAASTSAGRRLRAVHCRAPCSAARPRACAPRAAASGPGLPRARNAPMKPASRSPLPPVASPGLPLATTWMGPRRSAITVGTPFSRTVDLR